VDRTSARPIELVSTVLGKIGILLVAGALFLAFSLTSSTFSSGVNLDNIMIQIAVLAVVSIGETLVMLLRGIDLSVGSVVLFSSVVVGALSVNHHEPALLAIAVAVVLSLGIGLINGVLIAIVGVEPIIVTLAMLLAVQGLDQVILAQNGSWIQVLSPFFNALYENQILFLPLMAAITIGLYVLASIVMRLTPFGRSVYAVGGNPRAAHLAGINVTAVTVAAYAISGLFAGIAGPLEVAQIGTVSQNVASGLEFSAITAVLVGGLSLAGGAGSLEKTLVGAAIFGMIDNYLTLNSFSIYYKQAVSGFLILVAVIVLNLGRLRSER
jgi:ribose/xylose/arabinose/galactoside ABC-type transport system permease subunit